MAKLKEIEFFKNEYGKLQYGPGEIKLFRDEWEKLGYNNPKLVQRRLDKEYVCQVINTILRKYAEYRSEHEYAGLSEPDKIIFDWHYAFFNKYEESWLYRMVPAAYLGKSPAQLALHPKVMNEVKTQYTVFSVVLGSADDFVAYWYDNREHTNTVFNDLLAEGYKHYSIYGHDSTPMNPQIKRI